MIIDIGFIIDEFDNICDNLISHVDNITNIVKLTADMTDSTTWDALFIGLNEQCSNANVM